MAAPKYSEQLAELVSEIISETKRPEKEEDIVRRIKNVTLQKHRKARFWRDIETVDLDLTVEGRNRTIDLTILPPHRDILQVAIQGFGELKKLDISAALSAIAKNTPNCWYQLGHALHIQCNKAHGSILVAILAKPIVEEAKYNSWLAREHPYAIIDEVSAFIFGDSGQVDKQAMRQNRVLTIHDPEIMREQMLTDHDDLLGSQVILDTE